MTARLTLALLGLAAGCPTAATTPPAPSGASDARPAASSRPTILRRARRAPLPEGVAACLAREETHAVIRLRSATPDCSSVGHRRMVFEVLEARGAAMPIHTAYASTMLGVPFAQAPSPPGMHYVAALRIAPQPARTQYCVRLPATDALVTCAVAVDSAEAGRQLLRAVPPAR